MIENKKARGMLAAASVALALSTAAAPAGAVERRDGWVVRWGSFEVARVDSEAVIEDDRYAFAWRARSKGLLAFFFEVFVSGASEGAIVDGEVVPAWLQTRSYAEGRAGRTNLVFAEDGAVASLEVITREDDERDPVPPALQVAPDPSAFAVEAMLAAAAGLEIEGQTFDGKRVLRLGVSCDVAASTPIASLDGRQPLLCEIGGEQIAGRYRGWEPDEEEEADKPRTARGLMEPIPGALLYWPHSIEADTPWGALTIEREPWSAPGDDWPTAQLSG